MNADAPKLEGELSLNRLLDAPRDLVFKAWTDPKHLARWWGPKDFTNPVCEFDARKGGQLHIVMRGPDGREYPMKGTILEFTPPERLVFSNIPLDADGNALMDALTSVNFAEENGKTRITFHTRAVGLAPIAAMMLSGMEAGWNQSLDRLADLVTQL